MKIKIDCKKIKTQEAFHSFMKRRFDFPNYYGENLDALWDCLTEKRDLHIKLIDSRWLIYNLGDYGQKILDLFQDLKEENDNYKIGIY